MEFLNLQTVRLTKLRILHNTADFVLDNEAHINEAFQHETGKSN